MNGSIDNNIANNSILLLKPYFFVLPTYPFNNLDLFGFVQAYSNCNALTLFGKPSTRPYRRMGVALSYGNESIDGLVEKAKEVANYIKVS